MSSGRFWWSVVFICQRAPAKLKCFFKRRLYSTNIDCFVRDSSRLHLTFVAFCLLSVIRKQWLKQCNYSVDQSAILSGFRTDFTSSLWNFCRWVFRYGLQVSVASKQLIYSLVWQLLEKKQSPFLCACLLHIRQTGWLSTCRSTCCGFILSMG